MKGYWSLWEEGSGVGLGGLAFEGKGFRVPLKGL